MIPQETIDKLKEAARIEDVVEAFCTIKPKGNRLYADCPKCNGKEKITLRKAANTATCFKCDDTGKTSTLSPIGFLMDPGYGNMTYPDALRWLGNKYGITVEDEVEPAQTASIPKPKKPTKPEPIEKGPLKSTRPAPQKAKEKLNFRDEQLRASGIDDKDQICELRTDGKTKNVISRYTLGTLSYTNNFEVGPGVDMIMHYVDLDGNRMMYVPTKGASKKPRALVRVRYKNPEQHPNKKGDPVKYSQPPGSISALWLPERIRSLYNAGAQYDTLAIQEGEKKSDRSCKAGVYSVGAMGIHNIAADDRPMPQEFERIIDKNGVKNIIFFMDSDWADLGSSSDKAVDFRPRLFFRAVERFQRYFQRFRNSGTMLHIFWAYVEQNSAGAKGVDDLLQSGICTDDEYQQDVIDGLAGKETRFIKMVDITSMSTIKLKKYWHLNDPKDFAEHYRDQIKAKGLEVFRIGKILYRFNDDDELDMAQPFLPEEKFWEETEDNKGNRRVHFDYKGAYIYLKNRGYGRYRLPNKETIFILIEDGIISETSPDDITDYMLEFLETHESNNRKLLNAFYHSNDTWMGTKGLKRMYYQNPILMKDGYRLQHLFFNETIWRISQEGVHPMPISNMGGNVWQEKIIDFNAKLTEKPMVTIDEIDQAFIDGLGTEEEKKYYGQRLGEWVPNWTDEAEKCEFFRFLSYTSNFYWEKQKLHEENPKENPDLTMDEVYENEQHLMAKLSAIGHLLHGHRSAHNEYAIVAMEGDNIDGGRSEGRTGKSLIMKALRQMVPVEEINGKKERLTQDQFLFGNVTDRTQVVAIDDVQKQFDLEFLFPYITGPFFVRAMQKQQFTIPYEDSPKLFITTNFALKEKGGSFVDRRRIVAFSNFFNSDRKPQDHFGHLFFDDWEGDQWNLFYNLMACCLQIYFKAGTVLQANAERIEKRRLRLEIGETFLAWADEYYEKPESQGGNLNCRRIKDNLLEQLLDAFPRYKQYIDKRSFKKKLWQYALFKGFIINPGREYGMKGAMKEYYGKPYGGDLKTQGVEYVEMYTPAAVKNQDAGAGMDDMPF